ncbi:alpha/beta fold hydrolase [Hymenobacter cellulosivorans]|uniref:Alpha/beta hydrolase n=1 Tax=Hymenobacter cellulosivorans TaxID=2932249 RepID=A0ABY4FD32_9BACT|nr:alpha/beta hydrolase [Hymenobacter cellulosivorans]UOQ52376.1 alpha/beta hydrolase [Hymenobacter cellulosivorans]
MLETFKKIIYSLILLGSRETQGQNNNVPYVSQSLDISKYKGEYSKFQFEGYIYGSNDIIGNSGAAFVLSQHQLNKKFIKSYNTGTADAYIKNKWNKYTIIENLDPKTSILFLGIFFNGNNTLFFDDFSLCLIDRNNNKIRIPLRNADFENNNLNDWGLNRVSNDQYAKLSLDESVFLSGTHSLKLESVQKDLESKSSKKYGENVNAGKYVEVNGVKIYYEVYGNGEPLLLLHGNGESINSFRNQISELANHFFVIALDTRGQGKSTENGDKFNYDLFAQDVNEFLKSLNIKKANILGWSDGGNTALTLALRFPEKINKLAVFGANLFNNETSIEKEVNLQLMSQVRAMESDEISKNSVKYRLKKLLLEEPNLDPKELSSIHIPVLVMAGEKDVIKKNHTELIAKSIPNSKLKIFKNAGHYVPQEDYKQFNQIVIDFFKN